MEDLGLINDTPFAAQELYLTDEEGRHLLTVVVQATYAFGADGVLTLAEEQPAIELGGVYHGEPGESSFRYEPVMAPLKLATDVVLVGHAYADRIGATQVDVGFQVGPVRKVIRVFGDRHWEKRMGFTGISAPRSFERIPLVYERAFGGWDRSAHDLEQHTVEQRNPVGVGYHHKRFGAFVEGAPLPNLEHPQHQIQDYMYTPPPACFGFIGPEWLPRLTYAGTYDDAWMLHRMPLLPKDFDRRFYNAAPPDQIAPGYLRGDESVVIANAVPEGRVHFALPGEPAPQCMVTVENRAPRSAQTSLDTVILDTDARQVMLLWRAHVPISGGPHDVRAIHVEPNPASVHAADPRIAIPVTQ